MRTIELADNLPEIVELANAVGVLATLHLPAYDRVSIQADFSSQGLYDFGPDAGDITTNDLVAHYENTATHARSIASAEWDRQRNRYVFHL